MLERISVTVNQLIFMAIYFYVFMICDYFTAVLFPAFDSCVSTVPVLETMHLLSQHQFALKIPRKLSAPKIGLFTVIYS